MSADLLTLTPDAARAAIADWLGARGEPGYRLRQILPRLWERPVASWTDATDLPAALREALHDAFPLTRLELAAHQVSRDGTEKFLWKLADGEVKIANLVRDEQHALDDRWQIEETHAECDSIWLIYLRLGRGIDKLSERVGIQAYARKDD